MPAKKRVAARQINLIPKVGLSSSTYGRILLWTLSTFRVILIITEIFVIGAFISRFWLDTKNSDVSEEMKQAKSVISSLSEFEKDFKDTQNRLSVFDFYKKDKGKISANIKNIIAYKPPGVYFKTISSDLLRINISATSIDEVGIQQYLVNLKASSNYEKVSLNNISVSKDNSSLDFSLTVDLKTQL